VPHIKTTVVGSYPVLPWMVGHPSRLVLRDAVMAVLKTQELAGLELVTDGELARFDANHPEANGMVDYFLAQLDGLRKAVSPSDFERYRADRAAGYQVVSGAIDTT
jgi:5-methyltetrahydropteroyltriglutamate--homocysteine methyltransferase